MGARTLLSRSSSILNLPKARWTLGLLLLVVYGGSMCWTYIEGGFIISYDASASTIESARTPRLFWLEFSVVTAIALLAIVLYTKSGSLLKASVLAPIIEEYFYRFFIMYGIFIWWWRRPDWEALIVTSLIFGISHIINALWAVFQGPDELFLPPPYIRWIQVCEALLMACFFGQVLFTFWAPIPTNNFLAPNTNDGVGFLVMMLFLWNTHIAINCIAVACNLLVNSFTKGHGILNMLLHMIPRFSFAVVAYVCFNEIRTEQTISTKIWRNVLEAIYGLRSAGYR